MEIKDLDAPDRAPAGWVKRDPEPEELEGLFDFIATELGFLENVLDPDKMDQLSPTGTWEWDKYQEDYFMCDTSFICNKCRQSGGSAMLAAKAFARGMLAQGNFSSVMTSYKKEEAVNKIHYVKQYLDALPPKFRKKIIRDPLQLIEFENYNGTRAKIFSHAQKPIRGVPADQVGLDELAFYQWAEEVYASALPAIAMVRGTIDIISTPFGMSGKFFEIFDDERRYPFYARLPIFWWMCKRYLKEENYEFMAKAVRHAPFMSTEERVHLFGGASIVQQFQNASDLETFQQEFEGYFVDEQSAFFHKKLILSCMYNKVSKIDDFDPKEDEFYELVDGVKVQVSPEDALSSESYPILEKYRGKKDIHGKPVRFKKYDTLQELYSAFRTGEIGRNIIAGVDLGTTRHSTDIRILEEIVFEDGSTLQVERFSKNVQRWDLPSQQNYFEALLRSGIIRKMLMDCTGPGTQMGQYLARRFPSTFVDVQMGGNNGKQEQFMVNLKNRLENGELALEFDRQLLEELYSIERVVGDNRSIRFKAEEKKRHHADGAWALAFACFAGTPAGKATDKFVNNFSVGSIKSFSVEAHKERALNRKNLDRSFESSSFAVSLEEKMALLDLHGIDNFIGGFEE
ncbi:MAG: hypothetical protein CL489_10885 [Acidobacteria bacterium]|nr:hypothetical protein [Acidobacteriota bacterium]|tara:strand:+ start:15941 stop:17821 length:1881 start_codon:yes stop_codon:yes gene_type:complete